MKACLGFLVIACVAVGPVQAIEYDSFVEWSVANGYPGNPAPGDVQLSWANNIASVIGIGYDVVLDGIWHSTEGNGGVTPCLDTEGGHANVGSINVLAWGLTGDGSTDGVAVDGDNIYLADFNGDLNISDDILYLSDRAGNLLDYWNLDGAGNGSTDGTFIDVVLGVAIDENGDVWLSSNNFLITKVALVAGGSWSTIQSGPCPGGGSFAGIDYDPVCGDYFATDFAFGQHYRLDAFDGNVLDTFPLAGGDVTGITVEEDALVTIFTAGFGDTNTYEREGFICGGGTPVVEMTWGAVKDAFK